MKLALSVLFMGWLCLFIGTDALRNKIAIRGYDHGVQLRKLAPNWYAAAKEDLSRSGNSLEATQEKMSSEPVPMFPETTRRSSPPLLDPNSKDLPQLMRLRQLDLFTEATSSEEYRNQYSLKAILGKFRDGTSTEGILDDIEHLEQGIGGQTSDIANSEPTVDMDHIVNQLDTYEAQLWQTFADVSTLNGTLDRKLTLIVDLDNALEAQAALETSVAKEYEQARLWWTTKEEIKSDFTVMRDHLSELTTLLVSLEAELKSVADNVKNHDTSMSTSGKYVKLLANQLLSDNVFGMCNYTGPLNASEPVAVVVPTATGTEILYGKGCMGIPAPALKGETFPGTCIGNERHGQSCYLTCGNGFNATGDMKVTCNNGTWTQLQGSCGKVQPCSTLPPAVQLPQFQQGSCTNVLQSGDTCDLACAPGYSAKGSLLMQCINGAWSTLAGECGLNCLSVGASAQHMVAQCTIPVAHGTRCRFGCDPGYTPSKPNEVDVECNNGNFGVPQFQCGKDCKSLVPPVSKLANLGSCKYAYDEVKSVYQQASYTTCSVACDADTFASDELRKVQCQADGTLSGFNVDTRCTPICTDYADITSYAQLTGMQIGACGNNQLDAPAGYDYYQLPGQSYKCAMSCPVGTTVITSTKNIANLQTVYCDDKGKLRSTDGALLSAYRTAGGGPLCAAKAAGFKEVRSDTSLSPRSEIEPTSPMPLTSEEKAADRASWAAASKWAREEFEIPLL